MSSYRVERMLKEQWLEDAPKRAKIELKLNGLKRVGHGCHDCGGRCEMVTIMVCVDWHPPGTIRVKDERPE